MASGSQVGEGGRAMAEGPLTGGGLTASGEQAGKDRRASPRYESQVHRAWLGWHEAGEFHRAPCWFRDISMAGALIGVHAPVPLNAPIFLRLDGELLPNWYGAKILEVVPEDQSGVFGARLGFPEGCPYDLFMAVAYGQVGKRETPPLPQLPRYAPADEPAEPPGTEARWAGRSWKPPTFARR